MLQCFGDLLLGLEVDFEVLNSALEFAATNSASKELKSGIEDQYHILEHIPPFQSRDPRYRETFTLQFILLPHRSLSRHSSAKLPPRRSNQDSASFSRPTATRPGCVQIKSKKYFFQINNALRNCSMSRMNKINLLKKYFFLESQHSPSELSTPRRRMPMRPSQRWVEIPVRRHWPRLRSALARAKVPVRHSRRPGRSFPCTVVTAYRNYRSSEDSSIPNKNTSIQTLIGICLFS